MNAGSLDAILACHHVVGAQHALPNSNDEDFYNEHQQAAGRDVPGSGLAACSKQEAAQDAASANEAATEAQAAADQAAAAARPPTLPSRLPTPPPPLLTLRPTLLPTPLLPRPTLLLAKPRTLPRLPKLPLSRPRTLLKKPEVITSFFTLFRKSRWFASGFAPLPLRRGIATRLHNGMNRLASPSIAVPETAMKIRPITTTLLAASCCWPWPPAGPGSRTGQAGRAAGR